MVEFASYVPCPVAKKGVDLILSMPNEVDNKTVLEHVVISSVTHILAEGGGLDELGRGENKGVL